MIRGALLVCGLLIGPSYIFLYVLGGALREGYSHVADSVSELLSPGAPSKKGLVAIQVIYGLLHVLFGLGLLDFVRESNGSLLGAVGGWTIVAIGVATIGTSIFPQDAEGTPATSPGQIHKALVFGVLVPAAILSTLLVGLWSRQIAILRGFDVYSFVTVGAIAAMGAVGGGGGQDSIRRLSGAYCCSRHTPVALRFGASASHAMIVCGHVTCATVWSLGAVCRTRSLSVVW